MRSGLADRAPTAIPRGGAGRGEQVGRWMGVEVGDLHGCQLLCHDEMVTWKN